MPRLGVAVAALALSTTMALSLAACGSGDKQVTAAPTPTTPSPSAAATTPDPKQRAVADAEKALQRYYAVRYRVAAKPAHVTAQLATVAAGQELQTYTENYEGWASRGWHATGRPTLTILDVADVSLDNSAPRRGKVPTVRLDTCTDVTGLDVLDDKGTSVVAKDRPDRVHTTYAVVNPAWKKNPHGGWRVVDSQEVAQSC